MGNLLNTEDQTDDTMTESEGANYHGTRRNSGKKVDTTCLVKLFEKLESTATGEDKSDDDKHMSKTTFESAFEGRIEAFGRLMFLQLLHGHSEKEKISLNHFVKAGKEILRLTDVNMGRYYFRLFSSSKDCMSKEDAVVMVQSCFRLTMMASRIPTNQIADDDAVFEAMVNSMFGMSDSLSYDNLSPWVSWNTPHLFTGVHSCVLMILQGARMPSELETADVPHLDCIMGGSQLLTLPILWAISTTLPGCYLQTEDEAPSPTSVNPLLNTFTLVMHQAHLHRFQSWSMLYNSRDHGLSMNRFTHHVTAYHGPSVTLISCEGRNIYCVASDSEWREGSLQLGKEDCELIQISPVYKLMQVGAGLISWNNKSRDKNRGISVGKDVKSLPLYIHHEFDTVKQYGVDCRLQSIEVWGCGSAKAKLAQLKQKQWDRKEVEKTRQQKLRLDPNWEENPDKQLLDWGGIQTNHSQR